MKNAEGRGTTDLYQWLNSFPVLLSKTGECPPSLSLTHQNVVGSVCALFDEDRENGSSRELFGFWPQLSTPIGV